MATHLRLTITANNSGNYTGINRCYFATEVGGTTPVTPVSYFGSTNLYSGIYNFQSVYLQNGVWHSSSSGVPFIGGIVCADPPGFPAELVIKNTGDVAARSPKNFIVEQSDDSGSTWRTLKSFTNEISWAAGEVRRFSLMPAASLPRLIQAIPLHNSHTIARLGL